MKTIALLLMFFVVSITTVFSQEYFTQSVEELRKMKKEAVEQEDYSKASKINSEILFRDSLNRQIQEDIKNKELAIKNEDYNLAKKLKENITRNKNYEIFRQQLILSLKNENYSAAENYRKKLMQIRYGEDVNKNKIIKEEKNNINNISLKENNNSDGTALIIVNESKYLYDILIDGKWVFSLDKRESGKVQNLSPGKHKLAIVFAIKRKYNVEYDFEYNNIPLIGTIHKYDNAILFKTMKANKKGKDISNQDKYFHIQLHPSNEDKHTKYKLDLHNPVYENKRVTKYSYTNFHINLAFYAMQLPDDAFGKFKLQYGVNFINRVKSVNGLFWGAGGYVYMITYKQKMEYLSGYILYNPYYKDGTYLAKTDLTYDYKSYLLSGSFGYLFEPNDFIGLYSSMRLYSGVSLIWQEVLVPDTYTSQYMTRYDTSVESENNTNVVFGGSLNVGGMFFPFGRTSTFGFLSEATVFVGAGVSVGFNIGVSIRAMNHPKYRYKYYEK